MSMTSCYLEVTVKLYHGPVVLLCVSVIILYKDGLGLTSCPWTTILVCFDCLRQLIFGSEPITHVRNAENCDQI